MTILAPYRPRLGGVRGALPVAVARERARGERAPTLAPLVPAQGGADLEIDSAAARPAGGAAQIAACLVGGHPRTAVARLAARTGAGEKRANWGPCPYGSGGAAGARYIILDHLRFLTRTNVREYG